MKFIKEQPKETPVLTEVDVLVVGGGPSGLAAAIASAREGVTTMIAERYGCFGGVLSQVGVEAFAWYRHEGTIEAGGIALEFEEEALKMGGATKECQSESQALDAEMFKCVADKMILDSGAKPLLHCMAVDAIVEDDVIKGIIIDGKSGRQAILAKRVIDCTGDADIAALAGAPFRKHENLLSVTPLFNCKGVNVDRFNKYIHDELKPTYSDWKGEWEMESDNGKEDNMFSPYIVKPFREAIESGVLEKEDHIDYGGSYSTVAENGDVLQLNVVFVTGVDCTKIEDLTHAEMEGRRAALKSIKAMNKFIPGFENAKLRNFGMTIGTRESRQIEGNYRMTGHDVKNQARFEDSIGIFPEFIDGHGVLWLPTTGRHYEIPYRSLLPKKIENLLVAGRTIDGEKEAHASFRNMSCCVVTGQGAGVAAAISVKDNVPTSKVDVKKVQAALERQNVRVKGL